MSKQSFIIKHISKSHRVLCREAYILFSVHTRRDVHNLSTNYERCKVFELDPRQMSNWYRQSFSWKLSRESWHFFVIDSSTFSRQFLDPIGLIQSMSFISYQSDKQFTIRAIHLDINAFPFWSPKHSISFFFSLYADLPSSNLDSINRIYSRIRSNVQQSVASPQIHNKSKDRSKGDHFWFHDERMSRCLKRNLVILYSSFSSLSLSHFVHRRKSNLGNFTRWFRVYLLLIWWYS